MGVNRENGSIKGNLLEKRLDVTGGKRGKGNGGDRSVETEGYNLER